MAMFGLGMGKGENGEGQKEKHEQNREASGHMNRKRSMREKGRKGERGNEIEIDMPIY